MKKIILTIIFTLCIHQNVYAENDSNNLSDQFEISSNIGFVSNYIFRGISQSDNNFAVQGGADIEHESGLYLGTWASSVDFNDGDNASAELDIYGGYSFPFKGVNIDLGAIYYGYPNANSSLDYDFYEVYAGVSMEKEKIDVGASVNYTPENFGESGNAIYTSLNADYKINKELTLKTNIGYQTIDDEVSFGTDNYIHWGAGIGYEFKGFDILLKYSQADLDTSDSCGSGCDPKLILGVSRSF